ncbi:MAG: 50S ribosomal protein L17 [Desulfatitalea sp.]|nr:50S ribosomal protein L17 [Desulfatitalea sp.]NNK02049.1 50S ribosomal protein L17 [Desulfatitalea sp.]
MRHRKSGVKLNRTTSHRQAMFRNMVTSLFKYDRIRTTDVKAKELRRWADHVITLAKRGDLHARRQVLAIMREKPVVHKLFEEAQSRFGSINGGYTRIVKIGHRPGDAAAVSLIELVSLGEETKKAKKKSKAKAKKQAEAVKESAAPATDPSTQPDTDTIKETAADAAEGQTAENPVEEQAQVQAEASATAEVMAAEGTADADAVEKPPAAEAGTVESEISSDTAEPAPDRVEGTEATPKAADNADPSTGKDASAETREGSEPKKEL